MTRGKLEVRGVEERGVMAVAPCYGYEASGARHDETLILEDSELYMTFLGPLQMIDNEGNTVGVMGWEQAQALWAEQTRQR